MTNPRGRPKKYGQEGEVPSLRVRLAPDLHAWAQANGGPELVRRLLAAERKKTARREKA